MRPLPAFTHPEQTMLNKIEEMRRILRDQDIEVRKKSDIDRSFQTAARPIRSFLEKYNPELLPLLYRKMQRLYHLANDIRPVYRKYLDELKSANNHSSISLRDFLEAQNKSKSEKETYNIFLNNLEEETKLANEINDTLIEIFNGNAPRKKINYPRFSQLEIVLNETVNHINNILEGPLSNLDKPLVDIHTALEEKSVAKLRQAINKTKDVLTISFPEYETTTYHSEILSLRRAINAIEEVLNESITDVKQISSKRKDALGEATNTILDILAGQNAEAPDSSDDETSDDESFFDYGKSLYKCFNQMQKEFVSEIINYYESSREILEMTQKSFRLLGLEVPDFSSKRASSSSSSRAPSTSSSASRSSGLTSFFSRSGSESSATSRKSSPEPRFPGPSG